MISVAAAKKLIQQHTSRLPAVVLPLAKARGRILASDVYAGLDIPAFEQSSMDGYAIRFEDKDTALPVTGEMQAGVKVNFSLPAGRAARIFTGAPLPDGADTVVMQEKVRFNDGQILILDTTLKKGDNVRNKGAEVKQGNLAMAKDSKLTPAAIGFLAGIGYAEVSVYGLPLVGLITTGDELQDPGKDLAFGQVYESNSLALSAALAAAGIVDINLYQARDNFEELTEILREAMVQNDVVLLTGGVSVGDYDFVVSSAGQLGVQQIFHKIKQKPGKPLYFGLQDGCLVFGLPGNPSSVLSCYYNYVLPALNLMLGKAEPEELVKLELTHGYVKAAGLTHFLKGISLNGKVTPLHAQESFRLSSFAQANCLIVLEEARDNFEAGELVEVLLLPEY
ncbi:molybdopterin molybdotransferase MoeA [Pedobacter sp. MC2016-14]|uniref:molybdopterin molybdotransferase MoeA n=1 Tax=Pedobacter sp. MC2016-14 TaxID=2897327 RepID=UPI001E55F4A1|nr:gephyrin-like molybdotransferase Glp [Pedobacter sp. MC2016-14]MCD0489731.1 molybdopterin molybdotransferase MoeA [Pedobacter sp. MC2016-14]